MSSALLYLAHGGGAQRRALQSPSPEWTLVFRQNVTNDPSWLRVAGQFSVNPGDPANAQYSILDTLESLRAADGQFFFQLRWVNRDYSTLQHQTWQQTTNPVTATSPGVEGYAPIDVPYTGCYWGGLERSSSTAALIDGSVGHGSGHWWWYVIGATVITPGDGLNPGPCSATTGQRYKVRVTELYVCPLCMPPPPAPARQRPADAPSASSSLSPLPRRWELTP